MKKPDCVSLADWNLLNNLFPDHIDDYYQKIEEGYPIQYLIGYVDFFDLQIKVNENVLIPRFETEEFVDKILKLIESREKLNVIDLGTGSGCIACAINKKHPQAKILALDISGEALKIAKDNAKTNKLDIRFVKQDIRKEIKGNYDLIISNPPYLDQDDEIEIQVKNHEPHLALYAKNDGLEFYFCIIKYIKSHLNKNGILAFEINARHKKILIDELRREFPFAKIYCEKDLLNQDRFIFLINE